MRNRIRPGVSLLVMSMAAATLALSSGPSTAQTSPVDGGSSSSAENAAVIATYDGKKINLSEGWQGAQTCAQFSERDVRCYDSEAQFRADAGLPAVAKRAGAENAAATCGSGWTCLYEGYNSSGRKLQWSENGLYPLEGYGFRDKASSVRRGAGCAVELVDAVPGWWDDTMLLWTDYENDLRDPVSSDENWDNITDEIELRSC
ncbi:peptidase inhibitor family I36 protein [Streptomyces sp. NPDC048825]|uniref:peptidase inhibitor family I36 protein n=1 Tax=Streptomyces sp. NPDC048825 TaxID=3365592 RepID=UPI003723689C